MSDQTWSAGAAMARDTEIVVVMASVCPAPPAAAIFARLSVAGRWMATMTPFSPPDGPTDAPGYARPVGASASPPPPPPPPPAPYRAAPAFGATPPYEATPPFGSPPPYGAPPRYGAVPAAPYRPVAPARPNHRNLGALVVAAFVVGALSVGLGRAVIDDLATRSTAAAPRSAPAGSSSSTPSAGQGSTTPSAGVAAAIDPGVVDIESRVDNGVSAGTGMVLSDTGEILTNNHVIDGATQIVVTVVTSGRSYAASVVGTDPQDDLAVLQLRGASGLTTIPLGDSDQVAVGDAVTAIGNAGGQGGEPSVAPGTVVALDRQITASDETGMSAETLSGMIQIDAAVVPGDSGGPLANADGQVIGMNTAASSGRSRLQAATQEGFAIPINRALSIAKSLADNPDANSTSGNSSTAGQAGFLGVQVESSDSGAAVLGVQSDSPAATAGISAADTIVAVDGSPVQSADDLVTVLGDHNPGDQVTDDWDTSDGNSARAVVTLG